ncbi:MAG TPA: hypothetical protein VE733_12650 [Streptosporangiaceae bacterium]|nr:hypothetical protein [Streptosporangiaceae bacterium]
MNATMVKVLLGPLVAIGLLLSIQGCDTTASATASVTGPTPAAAMRVFNSYVTAEKVALASHDETLALSLATGAEYSLVTASFSIAARSGQAVPAAAYGRPTLYVPRQTTYPQWFAAVAPEHPAAGGPSRTAVLIFERAKAGSAWALSGSVLLGRGAPALKVATSGSGYASAVATSDQALKVRPDVVGAMHATIVDDGPTSEAATAVAAGPQTTGLYSANSTAARQAAALHESYRWQMDGTSYPEFALRTTDGGALVFYTMYLNTTTETTSKPSAHSKAPLPTIPVPAAYQALLKANQPPLHHQLTADQTLQFVALDPPGTAQAAKIQVIGAGGGPAYAHGY